MMTRISYSHDGRPTYGATYRMWFRLPVPNPNPNPNLNPNPKTDPDLTLTLKVTIMYAVQNDTQIKFKIVL